MKNNQIKIVEISKLNLKENEIVLAQVPEDYTLEQMQELCSLFKDILESNELNNSVVVIPNTTIISIIAKTELDTKILSENKHAKL